eukprot:TRINITY_DN506_c0_g1_i2.p1 TRINITY_DN506_c0_g1~~TRINITY_DN506_c0_g1_i2.p1  ORF type:complete len:223 (+),score=10.00 TRINITY_DN506_c0_g1_i2:290-958(+)
MLMLGAIPVHCTWMSLLLTMSQVESAFSNTTSTLVHASMQMLLGLPLIRRVLLTHLYTYTDCLMEVTSTASSLFPSWCSTAHLLPDSSRLWGVRLPGRDAGHDGGLGGRRRGGCGCVGVDRTAGSLLQPRSRTLRSESVDGCKKRRGNVFAAATFSRGRCRRGRRRRRGGRSADHGCSNLDDAVGRVDVGVCAAGMRRWSGSVSSRGYLGRDAGSRANQVRP